MVSDFLSRIFATEDRGYQSGFTLIEMLIAMFIFSLISVGTMMALTSTLQGKSQLDERLDAIHNIEAARALMKSDFTHLHLRPSRDIQGGREDYVLSGGQDPLVSFTRTGRTNPGGLGQYSEIQRVFYVFENGQLIRRVYSHENPASQTPIIDRVLMDDLANVSVDFRMDNYSQGQVLIRHGDDQAQLPSMISFEARFENGDVLIQHFELAL